MKNVEVYSELQKIIKDHEKKELVLLTVKSCLEEMIEGGSVDLQSLLKTVNDALK